jgi:hypothetical protein
MKDSKADGYLKACRFCGDLIYMKPDNDARWRPYESWKDGACEEGEWVGHQCDKGPRIPEAAIWTPCEPSSPSQQGVFSRFLKSQPNDHHRSGGRYA